METSKNINQERTYVFYKSKQFGKTERYEKKESELTKEEKNLLLGELISMWENNTEENQLRFFKMIIENKI